MRACYELGQKFAEFIVDELYSDPECEKKSANRSKE